MSQVVSAVIPNDFDWKTEEGEVMNITLNMMGGLQWSDLSDKEKKLMIKHGYNGGDDE